MARVAIWWFGSDGGSCTEEMTNPPGAVTLRGWIRLPTRVIVS